MFIVALVQMSELRTEIACGDFLSSVISCRPQAARGILFGSFAWPGCFGKIKTSPCLCRCEVQVDDCQHIRTPPGSCFALLAMPQNRPEKPITRQIERLPVPV